jgi:leucyl-tRNA synthetase
LLLLNPFAPHITEELWEITGFGGMVTNQSWPACDEAKTVEESIMIGVQVNGKVRGTITVGQETTEQEAVSMAKKLPTVIPFTENKQIIKEIYVKGRIVNIVVK